MNKLLDMKNSGREKIEDKIFDEDLTSENLHNKHLVRVGSKKQTFSQVNFSHTYFENCYFREIIFNSCDFSGCKFINCNFHGSTFPGSKFDYAIFEKTFIENEILDNNCPSFNNLTLKFARTLRVNYQSIGDSKSVNKAIKIELNASKEHLYQSWKSKATYYRDKYKGRTRIYMFFEWLNFKLQDFIWGNGESALKLVRTGILFWILFSLIDTICLKDPDRISNYFSSFCSLPSIFMGINKPVNYSEYYLTFITIMRFVGFALFTSIIIKRFNRR